MISPLRHTQAATKSNALDAIVGHAPALRAVLARATLFAPTRTPVLVTGESGTGKELVARVLHDHGPAATGPFVAVNCGALSRELAESELFGHERGAFTGAAGRRAGWFEEASGGTLVLDEIGELPRDLQPKLLRVLETGRIRRVGGNGETGISVRIVAMTLRDLKKDAQRGEFRLDLYHRLAGLELPLPPLRARPADIALLARHFIDEFAAEAGPRELDPSAIERLLAHDWPGNVRELRNVIRKAVLLTGSRIDGGSLELDSATCDVHLALRAADAPPITVRYPSVEDPDVIHLPGKTFPEIEKAAFVWALAQTGGSRRRAAGLLGISRSTFCDRVKRMSLAL